MRHRPRSAAHRQPQLRGAGDGHAPVEAHRRHDLVAQHVDRVPTRIGGQGHRAHARRRRHHVVVGERHGGGGGAADRHPRRQQRGVELERDRLAVVVGGVVDRGDGEGLRGLVGGEGHAGRRGIVVGGGAARARRQQGNGNRTSGRRAQADRHGRRVSALGRGVGRCAEGHRDRGRGAEARHGGARPVEGAHGVGGAVQRCRKPAAGHAHGIPSRIGISVVRVRETHQPLAVETCTVALVSQMPGHDRAPAG